MYNAQFCSDSREWFFVFIVIARTTNVVTQVLRSQVFLGQGIRNQASSQASSCLVRLGPQNLRSLTIVTFLFLRPSLFLILWSSTYLLDEILKNTQAPVEVQDHTKPNLNEFTLTKTCKEVRDRFDIRVEDRGCPWNCLEIRDRLSDFKGPLPLKDGANLHHWQMTDPNDTTMNRYAHAPLPVPRPLSDGYWFQKNTQDPQLMLMLGLQLGCPVLLEKNVLGSKPVNWRSTSVEKLWYR